MPIVRRFKHYQRQYTIHEYNTPVQHVKLIITVVG